MEKSDPLFPLLFPVCVCVCVLLIVSTRPCDRATALVQDKMLLETVASSVAIGAVLDQKQRWAAVMQVEPLRRVVAESLHQVCQSC